MIFLIISNYLKSNYEGFSKNVKEGLVSGPYLTETSIKQYNPTKLIFKLYDNLYYDSTSGNLIEAIKESGQKVSLNVFPRNFGYINFTYNYYAATATSQETADSMINNLVYSSKVWSYKSTSKYQITVIPYDNETYIHIMDISTQSPTILLSAYFTDPVAVNTNDYYVWTSSDASKNIIAKKLGIVSKTYTGTTSSSDKTNIVEPYYDSSKTLYQISQYVKYDATNGNLCIEGRTSSGNKKIKVYSRTGVTTVYEASNNATTLGGTTPSSSMSNLITNTTNPILIKENISPNIIIYWPVNQKTIITQYKGVLDTNNYGLAMVSVTMYNNSSLYTPTTTTTTSSTTSDTTSSSTSSTSSASSTDISSVSMSDMMKMMWLWKNMGGTAEYSSNYQLSDYVPKSSIVPPVCPACPACPGVSCPSCNNVRDVSNNTNINAPHEEAGGLIDKTGTAIGHGIASTGRFVGEGIENTASFAKSGIENTASFAKSAITGTASSATDAAKYAGSGVGNFLGRLTGGDGGVGGGYAGGGGSGGFGSYSNTNTTYKPDVYSYGGSVPSQYQQQGGLNNVQPIIADFSKFGR
jgi:hypothetical protein